MNIVKLSDIADVYIGATIRRVTDDENGTLKKVVVQKSVKRSEDLTYFQEVKISDKVNKKYFTKKGDILMKTPAPNDVVCVKEEGLIVGERIAIIRLNKNCACNFIAHQLNSQYIKRQIHKVLSSGSIKQITVNDIKNLEIKIPDLDTQKKYGEYLDSINERAKIYKKIIESDKEYQEGILNNLFGGK